MKPYLLVLLAAVLAGCDSGSSRGSMGGDTDPRDWLPGTDYTVRFDATLPPDLTPGEYTLAFGLRDRLIDDVAARPVFAHGAAIVDPIEREHRLGEVTISAASD